MGSSLRRRLTLSFLGVVLLGMLLAGFLAGLVVEQLYLSTQKENLTARAVLTAAGISPEVLPAGNPFNPDPYTQTTNVQPGIHTRLLSDSGAVLYSLPLASDSDPILEPLVDDPGLVSAAELLERSEIQSALNGQIDTAVRRPTTADSPRRVLYAAAPVWDDAGMVSGLVYLAMPMPAGGLPPELLLELIGAILLGGGTAGLAGIWLSRKLSRPLESLEGAAEAIAAGDLERRVPVQGEIRELSGLARTFNRMAARLQSSRESQNAFIADVTHELRTPMTVIKGTVETMEDGAWDDLESRERLLGSMHAETDRLIRLVNDLLVLTRADASALNLNLNELNLLQLAEERCRQLTPLASDKDVGFKVNPQAGGPYLVDGDQDRLAQVLDNLLHNAVRYSLEGSTITVQMDCDQGKVFCTVRDRGEGIPPEHLPRIFDRFYRVDPARDRKGGGAGLGLAIARALIEAQGGGIEIESTPGVGTAVTFWLLGVKDCLQTD